MGLPGRLALVAIGVIAVIGAAALVGPRQWFTDLPWAAKPACPIESVTVVVTPELQAPVGQLVEPLAGRGLPGGSCLKVAVQAQAAAETVQSALILPRDRTPAIWIPDSSLWPSMVRNWTLTRVASIASSPVVIATSRQAADRLGWSTRAPTWAQAIRGSRPFAVPDPQAQTQGLAALIALWQSLGRGSHADSAVVGALLDADRGQVPSANEAFAIARSGSAAAPLVPATEQQIAASNASQTSANLVAVYPREGSPLLDYPLYTTSDPGSSAARTKAIDLIVARLRSPAAAVVLTAAGFREPGTLAPAGTGISSGQIRVLAAPTAADVGQMLARIDALARPSRLLVVVDVSLSMTQKLRDGNTRIALAAAIARLGVQQLPDHSSVGLWVFSSRMLGDQDWRVLLQPTRLGAVAANGETARQQLTALSDHLPQDLHGGGTSIYDTTLAASRYLRQHADPHAVNAIVLLTDGKNDDSTGESLPQLLAELRAANRLPQPVSIYVAALGPDTDLAALNQIAAATGGHAYQINDAAGGKQALLDGLRRSRHLGQ